jgi:hypothetical protein
MTSVVLVGTVVSNWTMPVPNFPTPASEYAGEMREPLET